MGEKKTGRVQEKVMPDTIVGDSEAQRKVLETHSGAQQGGKQTG